MGSPRRARICGSAGSVPSTTGEWPAGDVLVKDNVPQSVALVILDGGPPPKTSILQCFRHLGLEQQSGAIYR
eukprot:34489-Lingulodinium_polyedra.AAC.1